MTKMIFVNLPVKNLPASMEFFKQLGYDFNMQFTDETAACMIVSEQIFVMLLTEEKFQTFIPHKINDAKQATEVLVCLNAENKEGVDMIVDKALKAGATSYREPSDYGFMYFRSFQDLDGHIWEFMYMDPTHVW